MTVNFVTYRLLIDYPLIIGNNQWLTDYPLITHRLPIDVLDFIDEICIMNYNYVCIISFIFSKFGSTGQNRFSLTFYRRNLVVFPWNLAWNSFYTVENPNLLGCPLNSPPIDKNFSSVKNLTINFQQILFTYRFASHCANRNGALHPRSKVWSITTPLYPNISANLLLCYITFIPL